MECLAHYPASLVEDLAALKRSRRKRSGQWALRRGIDYYRLYKEFLVKRGATHILMPVVETLDAKIAIAAAREVGIKVIAPVDLRNLTGTIFSVDCIETPPAYALADEAGRMSAKRFLNEFRLQPGPPRPSPSYESESEESRILEGYLPSLLPRIWQFLVRAIERPDMFDPDSIRVSIMNNFGLLRNSVRRIRKWRNARRFDLGSLQEFPEKFIFFPLQYSPEASINTPAPYFVDQFRVIDAVRFSMPSNYVLVVKEHPACLEMRPLEFMRQIHNCPGVLIADATIRATDIMKRAAVTVTVTGTAALEGLFMGLPTLALGGSLSSWALGGVVQLGNLRTAILEAIQRPPTDEFIVEQVARLISARYQFFFCTAHMPGEPMLRLGNMQRFLGALLDHIKREQFSLAEIR
jgi:hypothetical protein